jgi:hypothetical protein
VGYNIGRGPFAKTPVLAQEAAPIAQTEEDSGKGKAAALESSCEQVIIIVVCV